ncbi:hypothetical protein [Prevotella dentasini]
MKTINLTAQDTTTGMSATTGKYLHDKEMRAELSNSANHAKPTEH